MKLYDIIRFYRDPNKQSKTIKYGLTLEDAKEHCSRDDTSGDGWFDGFRESDSICLTDVKDVETTS